ncbi:MAG: substrate-binding domain-containing protein [Acidobacteriaceae bacterium]|nr:substrate-binding domain-containing protein [Acidobacteriaceae bacterium]
MRFRHALPVSDGRWYLLAGLFLLTASCNRSHTPTVAVIPKASADIFWQSVHAGAVKSSWANGIEIVWDGPPNETDIAGEMKIMETMIDRRVDAIAVAPSDHSALKIVVDRASAAGIPVVVYDSGIDTNNYRTFVATDNYLGGAMGADRLGAALNGKGKIVMVKTVPGGASTTAREDGFRNELKAKFPGIQILDERFGMAMISESRKVTENMLTAHPDLDGIFCSNESGSEGAATTLKARGIKIKLVGFDSSPTLIALLREGWIDSLVIQNPFKMGETAVDEAVRALRKEKTPKKIFLPPRLVNSANLNDPDIQAQLNPDLKRYLGGS